jgi:hypothetical protein
MNTSGVLLKDAPVEEEVSHLVKGKLMGCGMMDGKY